MSCRFCTCLILGFVLLGNIVADVQAQAQPRDLAPAATDPQTMRLAKIIGPAGTIFACIVTAVRHAPPRKLDEVQTVEITFHVDHAIRGVRAGDILTIREWAGLWSIGERYRLGEHVLLFLYPPSKLGLTSPVGGPLGRFSVDQANLVILKAPRFKPGLQNGQQAKSEQKDRINYREFSRPVRRAAEE